MMVTNFERRQVYHPEEQQCTAVLNLAGVARALICLVPAHMNAINTCQSKDVPEARTCLLDEEHSQRVITIFMTRHCRYKVVNGYRQQLVRSLGDNAVERRTYSD